MTIIKCTVNSHVYETQALYFKDFTNLGFIAEEKIFPFLTCLTACVANNLSDSELLKALYNASKDIFNREDLSYVSELALNSPHLKIDGKKLDSVEFENHWQAVGFVDYRVVCVNFIKANLGNFSSLSTLFPQEWAENIKTQLENKLSTLFLNLNAQLLK